MINVLTGLPVTLVCVMMRDIRSAGWQRIIGRRFARDFYCEGLRCILQRVGEEAPTRAGEPWVCAVDTLEGLRPVRLPWRSTRWLKRRLEAASDIYREAMERGPGQGPYESVRPLRRSGFVSGLLIGHTSHDDLLQIADCISGVVTSLVKDLPDGTASDWLPQLVKAMVPKFRGGRAEMFGNGLMLWPMGNKLWNSLRARLL